jgi:hypothetical protein
MPDSPFSSPPRPPTPPTATEEWSGITAGDLGYKAVYWTDDKKTALRFRAIVGWITFSNRALHLTVPTHNFAAIVMGEHWLPSAAGNVALYHCIAPKDATDEEILAKFPAAGGTPTPQGTGGVN